MAPPQSDRTQEAWCRRLNLHRLVLHRGTISTDEAARFLRVDHRAARGDLDALVKHHVPLVEEGAGRDRRHSLEPTYRLSGYSVGLVDRLALLFGRELVQGVLHDTDVGEAFDHLSRSVTPLDPAHRMRDEELARRFYVIHEPGKDYGQHRATLSALVQAILDTKRVSFDYRAGRSREEVRYAAVSPLTLIVYKRGVYLAFDRRGELRIAAVERIAGLELHADLRFDYPRASEYHPTKLLEGRFGLTTAAAPPETVSLRFDASVTAYVESRLWMAGQTIEPLPGGGCRLEFVGTGQELVPFALGFGDKVVVERPAWLRAAVVAELRRALAHYDE